MNSDNESSSNKFNSDFIAAPGWSKEIALARYEFLQFAESYIKKLKREKGKVGAVRQFLHHFNNHHIGEEIRLKLQRKRVNIATFYNWQKAFNEKGIPGLLVKYNNGGIKIDREIREKIEFLISKNPLNHYRYKDIYEDLKVMLGDKNKVPHYSTIKRYAKRWKKENLASLVLMQEGKKGLRDRNMELVLGRRDGHLTEPNQRWEIDTTLADIMTERKVRDVFLVTSDGKRCKVIGLIDVFSRSARFILTERETGFVVGQLLKDRILTWGLPKVLVIDNGKPFKNRRILGFCKKTGIEAHICIPGNPVEKPFIERAFRTLTEDLFRGLEGYTGNCIANRPNEIEVKYTMVELQEIINRWVSNIYEERVHSGTGQRPRERRNPRGFKPKTVNERELDILLMEEHERTVNQGYIRFLGDSYSHKSLPEGNKVKILVNDFDASCLIVYHNGEYLCTATNINRKGLTPSEIREARKERNRELRIHLRAHKDALKRWDNVETGVIARIDAAEKKRPVELPRKAEVVTFSEVKEAVENNTRPDAEPTLIEECLAGDIHGDAPYFTSFEHKYIWLRRRQRAGYDLDGEDLEFMEEFRNGEWYQQVGTEWEEMVYKQEARMEAYNEG